MINKLRKEWNVHTLGGKDAYGQETGSVFSHVASVAITMYVKNKNETDVRFVNSTHIGFTKDRGIVSGNILTDGDKSYIVEYANESTRLYQLFLKEQV